MNTNTGDTERGSEAVTNNDPHFRNLVDNALTGIIDNTLEGKILFVNQALARMLEFESPQQMQAEGTLLRWCDPERRKAFISSLEQQGYVNNYEADLFSKTGKHMHVLLSARLQGDVISSMVVDITDRKKTETALQESNERFRATFEQAAVGLTHMAPGGRFLRVNQKFCDIVGYSQDELLQLTCQEITYPDDLDPSLSCIQRLLTGDVESYSLEKRFIRQSGESVWTEVTFSLVLDQAREPLWFVSVVQDISQRKQAEAALQNSEKRFRDIADNALEWIWEVDGNGKYTYASPVVEKVLGYKPEELLQKHFYDLFHPDEKEELKRAAFTAFAGKERFHGFINRNVHKNGEIVWLSTSGIPIIDESGELVGYRGADIDITGHKQTEEALQKSERKYRTLLENLPQKIFLKDAHSTYISCNKNYARDLGIMPEEIVGKTDYDFFPRELADKYRGDDKRILESGQAERLEEQYVQDGKKTWIVTIKTPVLDDKGTVADILGTFMDITEQKRVKDALLESEEKFRTLVTNTEEIVYMIAKDGTFLLSEGKGLAKLGMKPGQVVGKSVFELYKGYPDMLDEMRRTFNGETVTSEVNIDGNYFRNWYTPHKNHAGEIIGLLGLSVNITEQKQAENRLQEYQQRLKALASELTLTEERQRRNIALELHDQVGQSLAVMRMQLAVAQKESNGRKVATILDEVSGSLRAAIHDTRNIISDLSSPIINELGLAAALSEWLKERIEGYYGLESKFIDDGEPKPLDKDTEAILFRSVRELLTNVIKHANANRVSVSLQRKGGAVQIVVEDDGVGLADGRHPENDSAEGGFGLFSIRERMSDLNGSLEIESHLGRGVRAILTAPLEPDD